MFFEIMSLIDTDKILLDETESSIQQQSEISYLKKELSDARNDLKQFIYIASHDLQEPLRMVSSYVQLLQKKYNDKLDEDANEYIGFAVDGVNRLKQIINDLLTLSRLNTESFTIGKVDTGLVLKKVLSSFKNEISDKQATVESDNLPEIYTNSKLLSYIFLNLISNSLKYCYSKPSIKIRYESSSDAHIFTVSDNGIGIAAEHTQKIFEPFTRLHSTNDFKGSGIGLTICKRITDVLKGNIWLESNKLGTTFYFTVPKITTNSK